MAIEVKKTKGSASRDGVKLLIYGGSGCGKTTLLASMGRTIIISSEKGDLALNDAENCESIQISSLLQLREAYNYVVANKDSYDTVGIDSISEIGQMVVAELKKDPEFSSLKDTMKLWMKYSDMMLDIAKVFRDISGLNVVIIALAESVKNGFDEVIMPNIPAKKVQAQLPSLYDEVLYLRVNSEGEREFVTNPTSDIVAKDRSGKLNPIEPCVKANGLSAIMQKILS